MTWLRRLRDDAGSSTPAITDPSPRAANADDPQDSPQALRWNVWQLDRVINAAAGQLPGEVVVAARRVTDVLREVVDTSADRALDVYAVVSIRAIVEDYLPTTLRRYLALDPDIRAVARPSGRNPRESLMEQVLSLLQAALSILSSTREQDADALLTQGSFLRTKFSGSDLDL